jgi:predicted O-methyltransferase YrrM
MSNLFQKLTDVIPTLDGWGGVQKAHTLAAMVLAIRPNVSVEIGVYGGQSFFGLALAHKEIGKGIAIAIDPWTNEAAMEGYSGVNRDFWQGNPMDVIYERFKQNVVELSVGNVVRVVRKKSDDAEVPDLIDILHIDGQHTDQATKDVKRFAANVRFGGILVMDDMGWVNDGDAPVERAAALLPDMGFNTLYPLGTGAVFQRVR